MECPNCKLEMLEGETKCSNCGQVCENVETDIQTEIINSDAFKVIEKGIGVAGLVFRLIFAIPLIICGLVFLGISIYSILTNEIKAMNYETTTATLSRSVYDNDMNAYMGYYKYIVDGKTYEKNYYDLETEMDGFKAELTLRYDKDDPSKAVFSSKSWIKFGLAGLGTLVLGLIIAFWGKISKVLNKNGIQTSTSIG